MSGSGARRSPRTWTPQATTAFLRVAVHAYEAVGPTKRGVHKKITTSLNPIFAQMGEAPITDDQVRHKYEGLRKQYQIWHALCNKTGAGWNTNLGTIEATEEWWNDRVLEYGTPTIKRYQSNPIENLDLMQLLFQGTHATGQFAFTPGNTSTEEFSFTPQYQSPPPPPTNNAWAFDSMNQNLEDLETQPQQSQPDIPSPTIPRFREANPNASSSRNTARRPRKRTGNDEKLAYILDSIYERQIKKSRSGSTDEGSLNPSTNPTPGSAESTGSSSNFASQLARVKKFEDINMAAATILLKSKENRDVLAILDDAEAKEWLQLEIQLLLANIAKKD